MLQQFLSTLPALPVFSQRARPTGLVAGTLVRTEQGDMPVEFLLGGDRIVTSSGEVVELRATSVLDARAIDIVRFFRAGPEGTSADDLIVPADQPILVRDWRAMVVHGRESILTPAASLVDDVQIRRERVEQVRLFRLHFDRPQVIFANGVEVASVRRPSAPDPRSSMLH